jgi:hypothetical protein
MQPKALWWPTLATYLYTVTYDTPTSMDSYIPTSNSVWFNKSHFFILNFYT